jgi:hypothetical protein
MNPNWKRRRSSHASSCRQIIRWKPHQGPLDRAYGPGALAMPNSSERGRQTPLSRVTTRRSSSRPRTWPTTSLGEQYHRHPTDFSPTPAQKRTRKQFRGIPDSHFPGNWLLPVIFVCTFHMRGTWSHRRPSVLRNGDILRGRGRQRAKYGLATPRDSQPLVRLC